MFKDAQNVLNFNNELVGVGNFLSIVIFFWYFSIHVRKIKLFETRTNKLILIEK